MCWSFTLHAEVHRVQGFGQNLVRIPQKPISCPLRYRSWHVAVALELQTGCAQCGLGLSSMSPPSRSWGASFHWSVFSLEPIGVSLFLTCGED